MALITSCPSKLETERDLLSQVYSLSWAAQLADRNMYPLPSQVFVSLFHRAALPHMIILGKSGAGKGTMSKMLADRFGYAHLSIGDMHRVENERGTKVGLVIRKLWKENRVNSEEMAQITYQMLNEKFQEIVAKKQPIILDNFPTFPHHVPYMLRVIFQFKWKNKIVLVVPEISDEETMKRLKNRLVCSLPACGKSYNLVTKMPKKEGYCDFCHSRLMLREDDTEESIKKKMLFYRENILPAIRLLASEVEFFPLRDIFGLLGKHLHLFP